MESSAGRWETQTSPCCLDLSIPKKLFSWNSALQIHWVKVMGQGKGIDSNSSYKKSSVAPTALRIRSRGLVLPAGSHERPESQNLCSTIFQLAQQTWLNMEALGREWG